MEIPIWRILLIIGMIVGYLPAIRFRKHEYFTFFAVSCLIDPLYIFLRMHHIVGNFYYIPFFLAVTLAILPGRFHRERLLAGIAIFLLSFHFLNNMDVLRITAASLAIGNLVFLINENLEIIKRESKVKIFLALLAMNMMIHGGSIFLYFENIGLYTNYYSVFLLLDIASFALIAWAGPEKAIKVYFKHETAIQQTETAPGLKEPAENFALSAILTSNNGFHHLLTRKELEVFLYLCEGLTNEEIAEKMYLGKKTIESHLYHLKDKFGKKSVPELRKFAHTYHPKEITSKN